jgi:membrane fusion protein (multidrug efflux system)
VRRRILLSLLVLGVTLGCGGEPEQLRRAPRAAAVEHAVPVETVAARTGGVLARIAAHGSLVPRRESQIGAEVPGRIEEVLVAVGDRVETGDVLFRIDPEPFELALGQAEAGLDLAAAEAHQVQAELGRARALLEQDVLSEQEVERLATRLRVAEARERQALQQRDLAARNLESSVVRAPFAGSVAQRLVDEGTLVTTQPQVVVIVLQETATLEAQVAIPEARMGRIVTGDEAEIFVESMPQPFAASVTAVSDSIDPATRTYLVRMEVPNPERMLKAGAFLRAEIRPSPKAGVLVVPREAIRTEDGEPRVLVVRDGRVTEVGVRLGLVGEDAAEVLGGLEAGERVIVGNAVHRLAPGTLVRPRPAEVAAR